MTKSIFMSKTKSSQHKRISYSQNVKAPIVKKNLLTKTKFYASLIILVAAFVLYSNTLSHDYALDDAIVITQNEFTQKGIAGIPEIFKYDTFTGFWLKNYPGKTAEQIQEEKKLVAGGRYRPLSLLTFAIELEFFGKNIKDENNKLLYKGNPFVSHLGNIIFYALTSILLYLILTRIFPTKENEKWYLSFPFIVSLLFLAHPIHTEAVSNIKGRDEILTLFGSLGAMWFTLDYLEKKKNIYLILSGICIFLGLLSKEIAIAFLAIIPITAYYFTKNKLSDIFKSTVPLFAGAAIFLLIRGNVLGFSLHKEDIAKEIMNNPFLYASLSEKLATIFYTLWLYIKLLFFPHPLTYDYYPHQIKIIDFSNPGAFLPLILYLFLGLYAIYGIRKKKDIPSYSIWFYLLPLSVVSNIFFPVGTFMNERFVFISSIGFCLFLGWLIYYGLKKLIKNQMIYEYSVKTVMIVILSLYSIKTISRNKAWENDLTLFTTDVKTSYNSAKSTCSAGGKILEEAQKPYNKENKQIHDSLCLLSIKYLERSLEIYPEYVDALNLLGNAHYEYNFNVAKSLNYYTKVLELRPYHNVTYGNTKIILNNIIGLLNARMTPNSPEEIVAAIKKLIEIKSDIGEAYHVAGTIYGKYLNKLDSAYYYLAKANEINYPKNADFYRDFGVAAGMNAKYQEALAAFLKAVELDPNDAQTYYNIGVTYQQLGDIPKANAYISQYLELTKK